MKKSNRAYWIVTQYLSVLLSVAAPVLHASDDVNGTQSKSAESPAQRTQRFKLVSGSQYALCRYYVDMLNESEYTEAPVCERELLPAYKRFKAITWTEITDKAAIRRIRLQGIKLNYEGNVLARHGMEQDALRIAKHKMDLGEYPRLYESRVDMDHDSEKETVYRFVYPFPEGDEYGRCIEWLDYVVIDKVGKPVKVYEYSRRLGQSARLFYYDGRVYQDYWNGYKFKHNLEVNETTGRSSHVCGVSIVQGE